MTVSTYNPADHATNQNAHVHSGNPVSYTHLTLPTILRV